jgi:hypothetical protein
MPCARQFSGHERENNPVATGKVRGGERVVWGLTGSITPAEAHYLMTRSNGRGWLALKEKGLALGEPF